MIRYVLSYRWQLIAVGLLGMLALVLLLFVQTSSLSLPKIQRPTANEAALGATNVDLPAGTHAADRKFYANGYVIYRSAADNSYTVDSVHAADRKFFTLDSVTGQAATDPLAHVHPADRKFFTAPHVWGTPGTGLNDGSE